MIKRLFGLMLGVTSFMITSICVAQSIAIYSGNPLKSRAPNNAGHVFTMAEALAMPSYHMRTSTNWTAVSDFKGVRVTDVLERYHLKGSKLYFRCFDGYSYVIPWNDLVRYNVILAYERDGVRMSLKSLGPFALIYPRTSFPSELGGSETDPKFIWMIKEISVE